MRCVVLMVGLVTTVWVSSAIAGTHHTTESVTLRKKPGEKEVAVATIPANAEVTVIREEGRWVKVKYQGQEGYVTRTTLDMPEAGDGKPEGKWSSSRHPDGTDQEITTLFVQTREPGELVKAPAGKDKIAELPKGARLAVVDASTPGWLHVRDDAGNDGWIEQARIDNSGTGVDVTGVDLKGTAREDYTRPPTRGLRAEVGFGYRSLGMDMTANADGGLTNYLVAADAAALVLDVEGTRPIARKAFAAVDLRASLSVSSPGLDYPGPSAMAGKIPFQTVSFDIGARAGLRLNPALAASLRVGAHYDAFLPDSVDNVGSLPRERLIGATVGLRGELAPPHSRVGATLRLDVLAVGSRAQTPGLEDGTSNTARAVWGGATVRYAVGRRLSVFAAYDFGHVTTRWTGMSVREPGVTNASRVDTTQLLQLGIGAAL